MVVIYYIRLALNIYTWNKWTQVACRAKEVKVTFQKEVHSGVIVRKLKIITKHAVIISGWIKSA